MNKLMVIFVVTTLTGALVNIFSPDNTWRGHLRSNWGLDLLVGGGLFNLVYELSQGLTKSDPVVIIFGLGSFLALVLFCIFLELWTRDHTKRTKMVRFDQLAFIITVLVQISFDWFFIIT